MVAFVKILKKFDKVPANASVLHCLKVATYKALLKERNTFHISGYSKGSADNLPESSGELLL